MCYHAISPQSLFLIFRAVKPSTHLPSVGYPRMPSLPATPILPSLLKVVLLPLLLLLILDSAPTSSAMSASPKVLVTVYSDLA